MNMKSFFISIKFIFLLFILSCEDDKDTTPPELNIISPSPGSTIGEIVNIKVETTDKSGILKVEFFILNSMVLSDTTLPYEYEWNTTNNQDGELKIKIISYDNNENFTENEFTVNVDNESKKPSKLDIKSVAYNTEKMTVKWDQSPDSDFKEYILYYSKSSNGNKTVVKYIKDKSITLFDTSNFNPREENWYFLEVVDTLGLKSMGKGRSNILHTIPLDSPPLTISNYDNGEITIEWNNINNAKFLKYELFESEKKEMTNRTSKYESFIASDTTLIISGLSKFTFKYYQLEVTDIWGLIGTGISTVGPRISIFNSDYPNQDDNWKSIKIADDVYFIDGNKNPLYFYKYSLENHDWTKLPDFQNRPRAMLAKNDSIFIYGEDDNRSPSLEIYDIKNGSFSPNDFGYSTISDPQNGGQWDGTEPALFTSSKDKIFYSLTTGRTAQKLLIYESKDGINWEGNSSSIRNSSESIILSNNNKVYVIMGEQSDRSFIKYDPQTKEFKNLSVPSYAIRPYRSAVFIWKNKIFKIGHDDNTNGLYSAEYYNIDTESWYTFGENLELPISDSSVHLIDNDLGIFYIYPSRNNGNLMRHGMLFNCTTLEFIID